MNEDDQYDFGASNATCYYHVQWKHEEDTLCRKLDRPKQLIVRRVSVYRPLCYGRTQVISWRMFNLCSFSIYSYMLLTLSLSPS